MSKSSTDEILKTATKRLKACIDAYRDDREMAADDLRFVQGGTNQWDAAEIKRRKTRGRPYITQNELPKYVNQVVGEMREKRARVKVHAADITGNPRTARIIQGLLGQIQIKSRAEIIYDYAGEMLCRCGWGAWRVNHRKTPDNPFEQEVYMELIKNPFLAFLDPGCKDLDGADAKYGFVLEKYTKDRFEKEFPGKDLPADTLKKATGTDRELWYEKDGFFLADYYIREDEEKNLCQMDDGAVLDEEEAHKAIKKAKEAQQAQLHVWELSVSQGLAPADQPPPQKPLPEIKATETAKVPKIKHYLITADQIIEGPDDVAGKYVPVVIVKGPEFNVDGKPSVKSLIRDAKDAQRLLNFWVTDLAEFVDMIPKSPLQATPEQMQGFETQYAEANVDNIAVLPYNHVEGQQPPHRLDHAQVPGEIFRQIESARQAIREAIGMSGADVMDTPAQGDSGVAVLAKQKVSDVGTFAFIDNLDRGIEHGARIAFSMMREVYDTRRDVRIRNEDDTDRVVPINDTLDHVKEGMAQGRYSLSDEDLEGADPHAIFNDLTKGNYDVDIKAEPSYSTMKQESAHTLTQLAMVDKTLFQTAGDIIYGNLEVLGAEEIAKRRRKMLPKGLVEPKQGEKPFQMPPPPQILLLQAKVQTEQEKTKKEQLKTKVEMIKLYKETQESEHEIRAQILAVLKELHAPVHPADMIGMDRQGQPGETV